MWKRSRSRRSAAWPIRAALITFAPVRCATALAERRALVAVQLHVGEAEHVDQVGDLVQRLVDEHADELDLAPHAARDPRGHGRVDVALGRLPQDEAERPGAERARARRPRAA